MAITPYYSHAGIQIFHGDCREVLPLLSGIESIVSDPPYGMSRHGRYQCGKNSSRIAGTRSSRFGETVVGDDGPFDPSWLLGYQHVLLWGCNHFANYLSRGTTLVWLKRYDDGFGSFLSDAELAWLNRGFGVYCRRDISLQSESSQRSHPTQKPLGIMKWCVNFTSGLLCDPYAGSGTTLLAAKELDRQAIGIEIEERYCEIAAKRLSQEVLNFTEAL